MKFPKYETLLANQSLSPFFKIALAVATVSIAACDSSNEDDPIVSDGSVEPIVSNFDVNDEDWSIVGDAQGESLAPTYVAATDTESAHIQADDDATGGTWYFQAPDKFLGDRLSFYSGSLQFDLKVSVSDGFDEPDIVLSSGDLTISTQMPSFPTETFTSYNIALVEADWVDANGDAIDVNTFSDVLQNLDGLNIRGEFNVGGDTGSLDNVVMSVGQ